MFVVEQNCPYQDIDGDDLTGDNRHILGWKNDELVAYARILKSDDDLEPVVIGRVIVSEAFPCCSKRFVMESSSNSQSSSCGSRAGISLK